MLSFSQLLEHKRKQNANASVLGTLRFRTLRGRPGLGGFGVRRWGEAKDMLAHALKDLSWLEAALSTHPA